MSPHAETLARRFGNIDPRWIILSVTTIGTFMSILDSVIINIALPSLLRDFRADLRQGQLVLTVYLLALAVVIPLTGFLADKVGQKRLYMITLTCFALGSALCGFAWNLPSLIVFRAIQGLGGGILQPLGMAIVFTMITPLERGRFITLTSLPMLLAPLIGPTIGGYLIEFASWRAVFLINLPVGLFNLALAYWLLTDHPRRPNVRLDGWGFLFSVLSFPTFLIALSQGERRGWTSPFVLALAGLGLSALAAFIIVELRQRQPLLQLRLFSRPVFSLAMAINFVTQFSLFGLPYVLPLMLQQVHHFTPSKIGLILLPSGILSFLTMNTSGRLYNRLGPRPLALTGLSVLLLTTLLLSRTTVETSVPFLALLVACRGVAMGFCMMPVQTAAYNSVTRDEMSRATALNSVAMRLFGATGTAVLTTTMLVSLQTHGAPEGSSITSSNVPLPLLTRAFQDAFLAMAIVTAGGIILALFLRDRVLEDLRAAQQQAKPGPLHPEPAD